jgi:hypothetical protein
MTTACTRTPSSSSATGFLKLTPAVFRFQFQQLMLVVVLCGESMVVFQSLAQTDKERPAPFELVKAYLSKPPVLEELRYQKTVVSQGQHVGQWLTNRTHYVGSYQDGSFFLEERDPQAPEGLPLKAVGRDKNLLWHWQNGQVLKWEKKADEKENVVLPLVGVGEIELLSAANLGIPMLVNSSMEWVDHGFGAESDESMFRRDVRPEEARVAISGGFTVSDLGRVSGLRLERKGASKPTLFAYEYGREESGSVPQFFPRTIRQEFLDAEGFFQGYIEREVFALRLSSSNRPASYGPERIARLPSAVRVSLVYTNDLLFKEATNGLQRVEQARPLRNSNLRWFLLVLLLLPSIAFPAVWWFRKQPGIQRNQPREKG